MLDRERTGLCYSVPSVEAASVRSDRNGGREQPLLRAGRGYAITRHGCPPRSAPSAACRGGSRGNRQVARPPLGGALSPIIDKHEPVC